MGRGWISRSGWLWSSFSHHFPCGLWTLDEVRLAAEVEGLADDGLDVEDELLEAEVRLLAGDAAGWSADVEWYVGLEPAVWTSFCGWASWETCC